jgi:hypothetical protein
MANGWAGWIRLIRRSLFLFTVTDYSAVIELLSLDSWPLLKLRSFSTIQPRFIVLSPLNIHRCIVYFWSKTIRFSVKMNLLSLSNEVLLLLHIFSRNSISIPYLQSLMVSCRSLCNIIQASDELWRLKYFERWYNNYWVLICYS